MIPASTRENPHWRPLLGRNINELVHFCPITAAVFSDHVEVMRTLLEHAKLDDDLYRVVEKAIGGYKEYRWRPLYVAILKCNLLMVKLLLQNGASVSRELGYGILAVHLAVRNGDLEVLSALVEAGANLDWEDLNGLTPRNYFSTFDNYLYMERMTLQLRLSVYPVLTR